MAKRASAAASLLLFLGTAGAGLPSDLPVRLEGKILRKASDRLVLSLSDFEFDGRTEVRLRNRGTGEEMAIPMGSVYRDISYTAPLAGSLIDSLEIDEWVPYVDWSIPDDRDSLRESLERIYLYQNGLRRELGNALLEGENVEIKVSSRVTLNKIEKFHRIAARIAHRYLDRVRERDDVNTFLYPLRIEITFNPFTFVSPRAGSSPAQEAREVIYWEVHRVLTQHFRIEERLVDVIFDAPLTTRRLRASGAGEEGFVDEFPSVTIEGESIDCAAYLQRQGFDGRVMRLVRLKRFRDPFITDRLVVDRMVNEGRILGIAGNRVAVTFIPPFMEPGETLFVETGEEGEEGKGIPVVLETPRPVEGYTLTGELPDGAISRIRPGMPVVRR